MVVGGRTSGESLEVGEEIVFESPGMSDQILDFISAGNLGISSDNSGLGSGLGSDSGFGLGSECFMILRMLRASAKGGTIGVKRVMGTG